MARRSDSLTYNRREDQTNKQPDLLFCGSLCKNCYLYRWHRVILIHVAKYRIACDSKDQIKSEGAWAGGRWRWG